MTGPRGGPPDGRVARLLPGLQTLRAYRLAWLRSDVLAGLALSAILVPAGMGYAQASGLPAVTGLYATILPLLAYAVFGPSRILVLGPDSALIPLIASTVLPLAGGSAQRAMALAATLALLTGLIAIAASLARLGFVTQLLSKPIRFGYVNGIALTVIVSQLPQLFGFSVRSSGVIPELAGFVHGVASGGTNGLAVLAGAASLALILALRLVLPRFPGVLLAAVLATVAVATLGLAGRLDVVGSVPRGLPVPALPALGASDLAALLPGAAAIALVAFTDTSLLSRTYAIRGRYEVAPNQELLALGIANVASGLFQGFSISSSSSRTPVAESSGARTQLTAVVGAVVIALLLLLAPGLLHDLPDATLAAVVIAAALGLFEIGGVRRLYDLDRPEFLLSLASCVAVVVLGVLPGIAAAVGLSLLDFIRHAWRPYDAVLGRVEGMKGYHDVSRHPEGRQVPGLLLFRWDAPLFFANADFFRDRVRHLVRAADPPLRRVVVAAEPITHVDSTAADMLAGLESELGAAGIGLGFAELKGPVKDQLARYGLPRAGSDVFFPTLGVAVRRYVADTHVEWTDWEEEDLER